MIKNSHEFSFYSSSTSMQLQKGQWTQEDLSDFYAFLKSFKNPTKISRTQRIINTELPVLAIPSPKLKAIAKEITKGNFLSFLELMPHEIFEATMIDAYLIGKIKDFDLQKQYIEKLAPFIDNRAVVDSLKFTVKGHEKASFSYAQKLIRSEFPFKRRIGIRILFSFVKDENSLEKIFKILQILKNEEHYYVNMASAWLLCECFIFHTQKVLDFLQTGELNDFVVNKTISKARDSFRISDDLKEKLGVLKREK